MLDFCSIVPEKEWTDEYKECSVPASVLALAESVIQQAIEDIKKNQGRDKALIYIMEDEHNYPFSFLRVCELLKIDPDSLRQAVISFLRSNYVEKKRKRRKKL